VPRAKRVLLIHWNAAEAAALLRANRVPGFRIERARLEADNQGWKELLADPPDVWLVDLSRLPAHGLETARALRERRATRHVPVVFVGGKPAKVARVRAALPGAPCTSWGRLGPALARAVAAPVRPPQRRPAGAGGYSGTPLPKKLGMGEGTRLLCLGAPPELRAALGPLPSGARLVERSSTPVPLAILFAKRRADLARRLRPAAAKLADKGALWIAWPKKASGVATDVSEDVVRDLALAAGLVDVKVCAIDAVWSGLQLRRRRGG